MENIYSGGIGVMRMTDTRKASRNEEMKKIMIKIDYQKMSISLDAFLRQQNYTKKRTFGK